MRAKTSKSRLSHRCDRPCRSHCCPSRHPPPPQHQGALHWIQATVPSKEVRLAEPSLGAESPPACCFLRWKPCSHHGGSAFSRRPGTAVDTPLHSSFKGQASCSFGKSRFVSVCLLFSLKKDPGAGRRGYTVSLQRTSRGGVTRMVALVMRAEDFARRRSLLGLGFCLSNDHRLSGLDGASIDLL